MKTKSRTKSPGPVKKTKLSATAAKTVPAAPPKAAKKPPPKQKKADVDEEIPNCSDYTVFVDGERAWAATLNQTNVGKNANKYYLIQLLSKAKSFWVWNRWGRVGYPGQNAMKGPFASVEKAKTEFTSKLKAKEKRGYMELDIICESSDEEEEVKAPTPPAKGAKTGKKVKSALEPRVQSLVQLIFDEKMMSNALSSLGYDDKKTPLGKLSQTALKKGYEVLQLIENELKEAHPSKQTLADLSGKFYTLIPHDFGFQHMSKFVITSMETLRTKIKMIECLSDMKITDSILKTQTEADSQYAELHCTIRGLDPKSQTYRDISQYFQNTTKKHTYEEVKILDIYELDREGEAARMANHIDNHQLLWHGSRVANFVGILSQGLRIAPPEAPCSGYRYGKGIYFADMAAKSVDYCDPCEDGTALMLLCEAALGTQNLVYEDDFNASKLPKGKHSVKAVGTDAPGSLKDCGGAKMPWGAIKVNKKGYNQFNELIVYDVSQVKMRYLLKLKVGDD